MTGDASSTVCMATTRLQLTQDKSSTMPIARAEAPPFPFPELSAPSSPPSPDGSCSFAPGTSQGKGAQSSRGGNNSITPRSLAIFNQLSGVSAPREAKLAEALYKRLLVGSRSANDRG